MSSRGAGALPRRPRQFCSEAFLKPDAFDIDSMPRACKLRNRSVARRAAGCLVWRVAAVVYVDARIATLRTAGTRRQCPRKPCWERRSGAGCVRRPRVSSASTSTHYRGSRGRGGRMKDLNWLRYPWVSSWVGSRVLGYLGASFGGAFT